MMKIVIYGLCVVTVILLTAWCAPVRAEGWYGGLEGGYVTHTFKVHYDYANGNPPDDYTDLAHGVQGSFVGGYQFPLAKRLSLALQGRVSHDNAEWTLHTDEPADLTYDLPWTYSVGLLPEIKLWKNFSLFGELGIGQGCMRFKKDSPATSHYDETEWVPAYSCAGGIRYQLAAHWQAFAQVRYTTFDKTSFDSHLPDGTKWEMIESDTSSEFYGIGLTYAFGE